MPTERKLLIYESLRRILLCFGVQMRRAPHQWRWGHSRVLVGEACYRGKVLMSQWAVPHGTSLEDWCQGIGLVSMWHDCWKIIRGLGDAEHQIGQDVRHRGKRVVHVGWMHHPLLSVLPSARKGTKYWSAWWGQCVRHNVWSGLRSKHARL